MSKSNEKTVHMDGARAPLRKSADASWNPTPEQMREINLACGGAVDLAILTDTERATVARLVAAGGYVEVASIFAGARARKRESAAQRVAMDRASNRWKKEY